MGTSIEWTDKTWNPVTGCTKVSPGCAHCYAEGVANRLWGKQYPRIDTVVGPAQRPLNRPREFTDVMTHADRLDQPLKWKKPARIFVNSMSDLFHEDVPAVFIAEVFAVMAVATQHTFQVLTKRAERMRTLLSDVPDDMQWPLPNVWLGVSVENQHFADERIPLLLQTPAAVRFISAEPLLGPLRLDRYFGDLIHFKSHPQGPDECELRGLDWVIVGGESGGQARPFDVAWARSIVRQCEAYCVPVFVKQLGRNVRDRNDAGFDGHGPNDIDGRCSWPEMDPDDIEEHVDGFRTDYQGAPVRVHLRDKKGGDPAEWPDDLRVREFPA